MRTNLLLTLACLFGAAASPGVASSNEFAPPAIEVLPLEVTTDGLGGAGGERLRQELRAAQLVAIGEDHGFSGPPELTAALAKELARASGKPVHLAVEVGPLGTAWAARQLGKGGLPAMQQALKGQPFALPFLSNVEDARLAESFAKQGRLWGIDQEFIGSAAQLFDDLAAHCADQATAKTLKEWAAKDRTAVGSGRFGESAMSTLALDRIEAAGRACRNGQEKVAAEIASSARIYQYYSSGQYARNNEERSALMAGYFMDLYRRAGGKAPRVVMKMGAHHAGRGTSPTAIYDLGSYLPPLAAANGLKSLHVIWIPLGGSVRMIAPSNGSFTAVTPYEDPGIGKLIEAAGIAESQIPEQGLVLIPLQPIRFAIKGKQRSELSDLARFTLLGFDYLVTTRAASPATHFEVWDGR